MTEDATHPTDEPDAADGPPESEPEEAPESEPEPAIVRVPRSSLAWLPASPAVVAVVGAFLPWFAPTGTGRGGHLDVPSAFSWQAGRIGFLAPLALVVVCVSILGPRHGWFGTGQPPRRFGRDGVLLAGSGVLAGAVVVLTWVLLPASYTFSGLTWDNLTSIGYDLRRNPQPGYFLTIAAAADAVGCGVVFWLAGRRESRAEAVDDRIDEAGIIDNHDGEDPGR